MAVYKCVSCGLLNFAGESNCKKCGGELIDRAAEQQRLSAPTQFAYAPTGMPANYAIGSTADSFEAETGYPTSSLSEQEERTIKICETGLTVAKAIAFLISLLYLILTVRIVMGFNPADQLSNYSIASTEYAVMTTFSMLLYFGLALGFLFKSRVAVVSAPIVWLLGSFLWLAGFQQAFPDRAEPVLERMFVKSAPMGFAILGLALVSLIAFGFGIYCAFRYRKLLNSVS